MLFRLACTNDPWSNKADSLNILATLFQQNVILVKQITAEALCLTVNYYDDFSTLIILARNSAGRLLLKNLFEQNHQLVQQITAKALFQNTTIDESEDMQQISAFFSLSSAASEVEIESHSASNTKVKANSDLLFNTKVNADYDSKSEPESDTESNINANTSFESKSVLESKTKYNSRSESKSDTENEPLLKQRRTAAANSVAPASQFFPPAQRQLPPAPDQPPLPVAESNTNNIKQVKSISADENESGTIRNNKAVAPEDIETDNVHSAYSNASYTA